jgi:formylglycine-generating enzyme required for sulfatase activity
LELSYSIGRPPIKLVDERLNEPGMVFVEGGSFALGVTNSVTLPDFWIDKFELSNREFKRFMDAGGYRNRAFWKEPFRDGDRVLTFEEAMLRFRDRTGQQGPATWELGSFPERTEDLPVGGLSWFEAAAYAHSPASSSQACTTGTSRPGRRSISMPVSFA